MLLGLKRGDRAPRRAFSQRNSFVFVSRAKLVLCARGGYTGYEERLSVSDALGRSILQYRRSTFYIFIQFLNSTTIPENIRVVSSKIHCFSNRILSSELLLFAE